MLSKNRIKYIRSLEMKKYRKAEKAFLAEGNKLVNDLLGHFFMQAVDCYGTVAGNSSASACSGNH